ncbi:MAG TPA: hypothetical protein VIP46_22405 [Pyrinomonadaceae bacterium]
MRESLFKKTEIVANIAIIAVALLLGVVLVKRFLLTGDDADAARRADPRVAAGTKVSLPGTDWSRNGRTLLLVLSSDCRFCTESAPFYQRLARETAGRADLRVMAVLPQEVGAGREYLQRLNVPIEDVRQASTSAVGARVTPTLILIDGAGVVTHSWVGKLASAQESEVFERLLNARADGRSGREAGDGASLSLWPLPRLSPVQSAYVSPRRLAAKGAGRGARVRPTFLSPRRGLRTEKGRHRDEDGNA